MKIIYLILLSLCVTSALAQQSGANKQPQNTPPIPIIRGIVKDIVDERIDSTITPDQINDLKGAVNKAREANVSVYSDGQIAAPVIRDIVIDPQVRQKSPRMIRLSAGILTTVVFSDMNGNPWLVKQASFNKQLFSDGTDTQGGSKLPPSNIFKIQAVRPLAYGNVVLELEGYPTTVVFLLTTGQSAENDVQINARVVGKNPNAEPQAITLQKMPDLDPMIGYFLDGIAPDGAKKLKVSGGQAEVWSLNGAMYVRTRLNILSPAFKDRGGSADGMSVYKYFQVVPRLLTSPVSGNSSSLLISGY